ncbi:DMT family transporter [Bradyrhizobium sp. BR 1432]|uniref:DMT family transporter n=1 Tax=Bradyrhizobium sp. BR 1432 TaxID=3447966 RepID=UPI003EE646D9
MTSNLTTTAGHPQDPLVIPGLRKNDVVPGIYCMIVASVMFALSSALSKWQVALYPVGEVMFFRSASAFALCAALILPATGMSVFKTRRPYAHLARGLSQSISQTFTVIAVSLMPLAGAIAINFSASLWAALLSFMWLKERAGIARWSALVMGFVGVLVVVNPGADTLQIGALFALANAVMYGSVTVAVRGMTATEFAKTLLMWQMVTVTFFHSFLLLFGFRMPSPADAIMLILSGVTNAAAQYFWTQALHLSARRRRLAVLLPDARLGTCDRIFRLGRRTDALASDWVRCCCCIGPVPARARGSATDQEADLR